MTKPSVSALAFVVDGLEAGYDLAIRTLLEWAGDDVTDEVGSVLRDAASDLDRNRQSILGQVQGTDRHN